MTEELAELTGGIIVVTFMFNVSFYLVKYVFSHYNLYLKKHPKLHKVLIKIFPFLRKYHKIAGLLIIAFILTHFLIMFNYKGLSITGLIAASLMVIDIVLGVILAWIRPKTKIVRNSHRFVSLAVIISILVHIA